jgi:hypothetical protein
MPEYNAQFPAGSLVRIANRATLEQFLRSWTFHDPLKSEQLAFAGTTARVDRIGYYHGGDPLYELEGVPGVWHEQCLCGVHEEP